MIDAQFAGHNGDHFFAEWVPERESYVVELKDSGNRVKIRFWMNPREIAQLNDACVIAIHNANNGFSSAVPGTDPSSGG